MSRGGGTWRAWVLAWLGAFGAFALVAHGNLESSDSALTMHAARALWQRGDSGLLRADQGGERLGEQIAAGYIHEHGALGKVGRNGRAYVWFPVGHVVLLAPIAGVGDRLEAAWPAVERRWREVAAPGADASQLRWSVTYVHGHPVLTQGLIALLVPPACGATLLLLLFVLARTLGAAPRDAGRAALAIGLGTQAFALGRETLADGPGMCCLLAALWAVVRAHQGAARPAVLAFGGVAAGLAVSLRYQHAVAVAVLLLVVALVCRRRRDLRPLLAFTLGGAPFLLLLLATNHARHGSVFDTGYPQVADWYTQSLGLGLLKLGCAAGRGVLWLSPLLWLALPLALRRAHVPVLRGLAWVLFATPFLLFAGAKGWQGGECWGARYVTPGVVVLLALVLPQAQPWRRRPWLWRLLLALGLFANLTSVVAPVRGQVQLASQAARAEAMHQGRELDADAVADLVSWRPRYAPLHSNWRYLRQSHVGGFEDEHGAPRHGSAHTIEALFGVAAVVPEQGLAPLRWEDRCGRHLAVRFWADLLAVPGWWLLVLPLLLAALGARFGWRRLLAQSAPPSAPLKPMPPAVR
ncbi:MAG: glycosyltransferase family 39 protein [Planctomycetes bacterium]|nr:glycosyltransferase family 39 protein [Planctomycetota bacterium]